MNIFDISFDGDYYELESITKSGAKIYARVRDGGIEEIEVGESTFWCAEHDVNTSVFVKFKDDTMASVDHLFDDARELLDSYREEIEKDGDITDENRLTKAELGIV